MGETTEGIFRVFWILDFGFWIENFFLGNGSVNPSVALIFQIAFKRVGWAVSP